MVADNVKQIICHKGLKQKSVAKRAGYSEKKFNKEWSPLIAGIGTAIATYFVATKVAGFVTAIKGAITAFASAPTVIAGVKAAMAALNITMSANPIGLIVAAIAGLVAAFVGLWSKSEAFRNFWIDLWDGIKSTCAEIAGC